MGEGKGKKDDQGLASVLPLPDFEEVSPEAPPDQEPPDRPSARPGSRDRERAAVAPELRLRRLPMQEQLRLCRRSTNPTERRLLQRVLGRSSWEPLLENPNLTPPEVAVIARKAAIPSVLLDRIVNQRRWLEVPAVRRALLANPKLQGGAITRVLRATPPHELRLVPKQTAYPAPVRAAARRLLGSKPPPRR
jgi:hypothetical protein